MLKNRFIAGAACAALLFSPNVYAQEGIDFGDDASMFANDGECDDKRFIGEGMTSTTLLDSDVGHDATDCRDAYYNNSLRLRDGVSPALENQETHGSASIDFGNDDSIFANDGECDDKRFIGEGMTSTTLLDSDVGRDATDCRNAYYEGTLSLRDGAASTLNDSGNQISDGIDFGDDRSMFANDGECDDKRFIGEGMTGTTLLDSDVSHDATDCREAYYAGTITLR